MKFCPKLLLLVNGALVAYSSFTQALPSLRTLASEPAPTSSAAEEIEIINRADSARSPRVNLYD